MGFTVPFWAVLQYFGWQETSIWWWWLKNKNRKITWIWSQRCYVVQLRRRGVLSPTGTNIDIKLSFYFQNHWTETIIVNHQHRKTCWLKPSSGANSSHGLIAITTPPIINTTFEVFYLVKKSMFDHLIFAQILTAAKSSRWIFSPRKILANTNTKT